MDYVWETLQKINASVGEPQKSYTTFQAENRTNFVNINWQMKALENSSETTLQIQVPVFSYGKLSTITLAGQLIALTFVPTLIEIADPNVSANNAMARWLLEPLQVEFDSDITSIPWTLHEPLAWSPDILTLISQSQMKSKTCHEMVFKIASQLHWHFWKPSRHLHEHLLFMSWCSQAYVAIFSMAIQANTESLRAYLKRFLAKLVEIEKSYDRLATMGFKQGLYVYSLLSQKLNKKKYDIPPW